MNIHRPFQHSRRIYAMRPVGLVGPIKIGCSKDPDVRLEALAAWSPIPLEIIASSVGDFPTEQLIHDSFANHRSHGEWFFPADPVLRFVSYMQRGMAAAGAIEAVTGGAKPVRNIRSEAMRAWALSRKKRLSLEAEPAA